MKNAISCKVRYQNIYLIIEKYNQRLKKWWKILLIWKNATFALCNSERAEY